MDILAKNGLTPEDLEPSDVLGDLTDAMAELSETVSDNAIDTADVMDALAELSEIVSQLVEGE